MAIAAVALPFVIGAKPPDVGEGRALWQVWPFTPLLLVVALGALVVLAQPGRVVQWLTLLLSEGLSSPCSECWLAATHMTSAESPLARTTVAVANMAVAGAVSAGLQRCDPPPDPVVCLALRAQCPDLVYSVVAAVQR